MKDLHVLLSGDGGYNIILLYEFRGYCSAEAVHQSIIRWHESTNTVNGDDSVHGNGKHR